MPSNEDLDIVIKQIIIVAIKAGIVVFKPFARIETIPKEHNPQNAIWFGSLKKPLYLGAKSYLPNPIKYCATATNSIISDVPIIQLLTVCCRVLPM